MNIVKVIIFGAIVYAWFYFGLPVLRVDNPNIYISMLFFSIVMLLLNFTLNPNKEKWRFVNILALGCASLFTIIIIIMNVLSMKWPNEVAYKNLIGDIEYKVYEDVVPPIDQSKIFVIPTYTASLLGEKALVDPNDTTENVIGSQVRIGDYTLQEVNNEIYYVAPTIHKSYWKWRKNKDGTPGYIMVNAVNEKDVQYIDEYPIKYQPGACFKDNLERHVWLNGYSSTYLTDYKFEIDDNGKPYWVVTKFERKIGISGKDAVGCLIVDAQNGDIEEYSIDSVPLWVDRIQPKDFIHEQLTNWGSLAMGYINFEDKNKKNITDGMSVVYGNDGECYYYTGVTSTGSDNATIGFIEVNTKTKKAVLYKKAGATEEAAMRSANDLYSDLGYESTFPKTYNINGTTTYIMGMMASSGMIKSICMVSVKNFNTVGTGKTIDEALRDYRGVMFKNINDIVLTKDAKKDLKLKIVERIKQDAESGLFYLLLDSSSKMTQVDGASFEEVFLTQEGDSVVIGLLPSASKSSPVVYFDNINLDINVSEEQKKLEESLKKPVNWKPVENKPLVPNSI